MKEVSFFALRFFIYPTLYYNTIAPIYRVVHGKYRSHPTDSYIPLQISSPQPPPWPFFQTNNGSDNWVTVPTNSTLTIHKQTVMIHPINDQYYNHSPSYVRSSGFVVSQGLVSGAAGDGADADREEEEAKDFGTREGGNKENFSPLADSDRVGLGKVVRKELGNGMNGG